MEAWEIFFFSFFSFSQGYLAVWSLFSTWYKAHGYKASGRLACGLVSKEQGFLNFLFGFCCFDTQVPSAGCNLPSLWGREGLGSHEPAPSNAGWWPLRMGPCVGFARLATRLLPFGFQRHVTGDWLGGSPSVVGTPTL